MQICFEHVVLLVLFQAQCDRQASMIVEEFIKKRQFSEKVGGFASGESNYYV